MGWIGWEVYCAGAALTVPAASSPCAAEPQLTRPGQPKGVGGRVKGWELVLTSASPTFPLRFSERRSGDY